MIDTLQIKQLDRGEKLQVMECIWQDLSSENQEPIHSPDWHKQLLLATEKRYKNGLETPIAWSDAKRELRKQFE